MIRKHKRPKMGVRKPSQLRSLEHLRFVRGHECAVRSHWAEDGLQHVCIGPIQAAHIRAGADGGMGLKPSDNYTIPLCANAHAGQHEIGEAAFENRYGIDTHKIAAELWRRSPARIRMERKNGV